MASLLLENVPPAGYPPVPGGFLDLDSAWSQILRACLGLEGGRPDVLTLLRWTMSADSVARYAGLPDAAKPHVSQWIAESSGPIGELVMRCVASGNGLDALPIGLVCGVIFAPSGKPQPELAAAAVRLERFTGGRRIRDEEGKRWAEAAAWVVRNSDVELVRPYIGRADGLLHELHLLGFASLSASYFGGEVKYTKRYQLGQKLGQICRHLLLMTATPHNGKEEDFQLFMALLDGDRFEGRFRDGVHFADTNDMMRRLTKEELLKFDGCPLFPERRAYTAKYDLSDEEAALYGAALVRRLECVP